MKLYKNYATLRLLLIIFNIAFIPFLFALVYDGTNNIFYSLIPLPILTLVSITTAVIYRKKTKAYYLMDSKQITSLDNSKVINIDKYQEIKINYHEKRIYIFKIAIFVNKDSHNQNEYLILPILEIKKISKFYKLPTKKIYDNGFKFFFKNLKEFIKEDYKAIAFVVIGILFTILSFVFNKYFNNYVYIKIGLSIIFFVFSFFQIKYLLLDINPLYYAKKDLFKKSLFILLFLTIFVMIVFGLLCLILVAFGNRNFDINYLFYSFYLTPTSLLICLLTIFVLGCMGYSG